MNGNIWEEKLATASHRVRVNDLYKFLIPWISEVCLVFLKWFLW